MTRIEYLESELQDLKNRLADLERQHGIETPEPVKSGKPINHAAFDRAVSDYLAGNKKAIREHMKIYRIA